MRALLLVLVLTILSGCQQARVARYCPCGELSAEMAYAIAVQGLRLVRERRSPSLAVPDHVVLKPTYDYPPIATIEIDPDARTAEIEFDRGAMEMLGDNLGPGAPIGIFAHELAHADHALSRRVDMSDHERELYADSVAGCALALVSCHLSGFTAFLRSTGGGTATTHPAPPERIEAAQRGYDSCAPSP